MKKTRRGVSIILLFALLLGCIPAFSIVTSALDSPFLSSVLEASGNAISNVVINSSESIGYNNEVTLYQATITSTGMRRDDPTTKLGKSSNTFSDTFSGVNIAVGGRLFTYSVPTENGLDFTVAEIEDIAARFEADHPEWKVAVVSNGTFFDNGGRTQNDDGTWEGTESMGEPEDPYMQDGKLYKSWQDSTKYGRGVIGLKSDGSMLYFTREKSGDTYYTDNGNLTKYSFVTNYRLQVLGENKNSPIYSYTMVWQGNPDYTSEPVFIAPTSSARNFTGCYVYKVKCSDYRRAHTGVSNVEKGDLTFYFEGEIESILEVTKETPGATSMKPDTGYVYIASYKALEHLQVGTCVRGTRPFAGDWTGVEYAFGFKQQILLEGEPLFKNVNENTTSSSAWYNRCDEVKYADYGTNRTAVGFKADGTPVIISMPRKVYYTSAGKFNTETSATSYELAWYMKSLGCVNAFLMDCGGSVRMYKKSTDSTTYESVVINPSNTKDGDPVAERKVANALILAYPSGETAKPKDTRLDDPDFSTEYILAKAANWYSGVTILNHPDDSSDDGKMAKFTNESSEQMGASEAINGKNFTLTQSAATYTFSPNGTKFASGYEAAIAYKKLGYTVQEGRKYTYCVKLHTLTETKYAAFLFGETPSNTETSKSLDNFATISGAFSNNGDSTYKDGTTTKRYSDVRIGFGRQGISDFGVLGIEPELKLHLETVDSKAYSYYRIDIDGLNYTVQFKGASGRWIQLEPKSGVAYYTLPEGTELVLGCASWEANTARAMAINDAVCVDITDLSNNITAASNLSASDYTQQSWDNLQTYLTKARYSVELTNQTLIDYANTSLESAISDLEKLEDIANAGIAEYEATNKAEYSAESWTRYESAYNAIVEAVNANDFTNMEALYAEYQAARNALSSINISVDIEWQEMNFVYSPVNTNDPSGGWSCPDNSNVISVKNKSNVGVDVGFGFVADEGFESLRGEFYSDGELLDDNTVELSVDESASVNFDLGGEFSSTVDGVKVGSVSLTISQSAA